MSGDKSKIGKSTFYNLDEELTNATPAEKYKRLIIFYSPPDLLLTSNKGVTHRFALGHN